RSMLQRAPLRSDCGSKLGLLLSGTIVVLVSCGHGRRSISPSATTTVTNVAATASECGGCHENETVAWRASMHSASFSNEDFQMAYREEPLAFCVNCHAPSPKEGAALGANHGVGCVSCHGSNAHAASRVGDEVCARCHEFENPIAQTLLQSTVSEHAASLE